MERAVQCTEPAEAHQIQARERRGRQGLLPAGFNGKACARAAAAGRAPRPLMAAADRQPGHPGARRPHSAPDPGARQRLLMAQRQPRVPQKVAPEHGEPQLQRACAWGAAHWRAKSTREPRSPHNRAGQEVPEPLADEANALDQVRRAQAAEDGQQDAVGQAVEGEGMHLQSGGGVRRWKGTKPCSRHPGARPTASQARPEG